MKSIYLLSLIFFSINNSSLALSFSSSGDCFFGILYSPLCNAWVGIANCDAKINIAQSILIQSITVAVDVVHGKAQEIVISLIGPDGTKVILHNKISGTNVQTTYPTQTVPIYIHV